MQEKLIKKAVRKAKKSYEKHISKTSNSSEKKFNSYIKSRTKVKTSIGPLKDENGETHTEPKNMAEILNNSSVEYLPEKIPTTSQNLKFIILMKHLNLLTSPRKRLWQRLTNSKMALLPATIKLRLYF